MLEYIENSEPWTGQRINGVAHPPNIEQLWSDGELAAIGLRKRAPVAPPQVSLDDLKQALSFKVDEQSEVRRLKYITPGDGKSLSYREGYDEAVEVLDNPQAALDMVGQAATDPAFRNLCEENYPVLYPDIGKGGTTDIEGIATLVASTFEAFQKVENAIKRTANPAKDAISAAQTVEAAQAAYDAIQWPV